MHQSHNVQHSCWINWGKWGSPSCYVVLYWEPLVGKAVYACGSGVCGVRAYNCNDKAARGEVCAIGASYSACNSVCAWEHSEKAYHNYHNYYSGTKACDDSRRSVATATRICDGCYKATHSHNNIGGFSNTMSIFLSDQFFYKSLEIGSSNSYYIHATFILERKALRVLLGCPKYPFFPKYLFWSVLTCFVPKWHT